MRLLSLFLGLLTALASAGTAADYGKTPADDVYVGAERRHEPEQANSDQTAKRARRERHQAGTEAVCKEVNRVFPKCEFHFLGEFYKNFENFKNENFIVLRIL